MKRLLLLSIATLMSMVPILASEADDEVEMEVDDSPGEGGYHYNAWALDTEYRRLEGELKWRYDEAPSKVCSKKKLDCCAMYPEYCLGKCTCDVKLGHCVFGFRDLHQYLGPVSREAKSTKTWDQLCDEKYSSTGVYTAPSNQAVAYPKDKIKSGTKYCWYELAKKK